MENTQRPEQTVTFYVFMFNVHLSIQNVEFYTFSEFIMQNIVSTTALVNTHYMNTILDSAEYISFNGYGTIAYMVW